MRERLLVRHFLWRFLEHDLVSPHTDRRMALSTVAGGLAALSLLVTTLIAQQYLFFSHMPPGVTSVRWLDDRFFFTSASMLVMALAAVVQWDALALDPRDTATLGVLPVPHGAIVRAKFAAVGVFALGVAVAWNAIPTLLRVATIPAALGVSIAGAIRLTAAHGVDMLAAGAFGFLAILGLREGLSAVLGEGRFRRVSSLVQGLLVLVLVTASLLLPGAHGRVAQRWLAPGGPGAVGVPSMWFVGLHETLAGSVVDSLPRERSSGRFAVRFEDREQQATALYRGLWPRYHQLSRVALLALVMVTGVTTVACVWNNRRLPVPIVGATHERHLVGRAFRWLAVRGVVRSPLSQAGFFFTLQTLSRQVPHRVIVAASWAVAVALARIATPGHAEGAASGGTVALGVLAGQSLMLASVFGGLRQTIGVPAQIRASTTFCLAWTGRGRPYLSGVARAGWLAFVAPTLVGLLLWLVPILGLRVAALHAGIGVALSVVLLDLLFVGDRRVPFVSTYVQTADPKALVVGGLGAALFVSFAFARAERFALGNAYRYVGLLAFLTALSGTLRVIGRASGEAAPSLRLDEEEALPTQRLNLWA